MQVSVQWLLVVVFFCRADITFVVQSWCCGSFFGFPRNSQLNPLNCHNGGHSIGKRMSTE
jgi:hypothetical protein